MSEEPRASFRTNEPVEVIDLQPEQIPGFLGLLSRSRDGAEVRLREVNERFPGLDASQHPHDYNQVCVSTRSILAQNDTHWRREARRLRAVLMMMRDNADAAGASFASLGSAGAPSLAADMKRVCQLGIDGATCADINRITGARSPLPGK